MSLLVTSSAYACQQPALQPSALTQSLHTQVISYKWLARKFGLPCNLAKQTLFSFLEQHRGKVKATYLLAGWTNTEPRQHTVQLVDSEHLSTKRSSLDPVTSMHVYSLQPAQPKVGLYDACSRMQSICYHVAHPEQLVCRRHLSCGIMMRFKLQSFFRSSGWENPIACQTTGKQAGLFYMQIIMHSKNLLVCTASAVQHTEVHISMHGCA